MIDALLAFAVVMSTVALVLTIRRDRHSRREQVQRMKERCAPPLPPLPWPPPPEPSPPPTPTGGPYRTTAARYRVTDPLHPEAGGRLVFINIRVEGADAAAAKIAASVFERIEGTDR